jgi:hypothetical protein
LDGSVNRPVVYQIRVRGRLATRWSDWLGGLAISIEETTGGAPEAILTGPVADQTALRGILNRLWDLNLTVVCVNPIDTPSPEEPRP